MLHRFDGIGIVVATDDEAQFGAVAVQYLFPRDREQQIDVGGDVLQHLDDLLNALDSLLAVAFDGRGSAHRAELVPGVHHRLPKVACLVWVHGLLR
ncbi:hypothetical protein [Azohydromonas australica]|uniref:hypothetical protein n=1 Tax=Azohydromonas australica TaxID=364039 RepID=UPI0004909A77|nr:hypothetical protein [Azohydromonas australica]